ncbi:hypothetical protein SAMD00019534_058640 [Acytostelium subglobosum LB1]|uniref:hypothetical protein n=1 Tax=Acytostelium subglobosum LB1 TaxID=1410327 RepID=UPI000644EC9B|nr:hypothetical protein SAMD00019534_058640 [Acytostelium subglobosum LB1]GAM22689.1 hypothetical protein SAMD00019534_058640 [Acytostelium subglobosum LB1]|eukprot:XP_012754809.1 hypothetical protein SAMD00019534_058640 [Acytostelium subglobosum LB1]
MSTNRRTNRLDPFGYHFNQAGQLRSTPNPEEKFKFVTQDHYERLGDTVALTIQDMMKEAPYNLQEILIPVAPQPQEEILPPLPQTNNDDDDKKARSNIFISNDFYTNTDRLMVIICGSGQVRAGQWARSLCINDSLKTGSILPYLERAELNGFATIVLNPNLNFVGNSPVEGSESPINHALYCYDNFVAKSPAQQVVIVAHSFGGVVTMNLLSKRKPLLERLKAVALTDSVHSPHQVRGDTEQLLKFLQDRCRNWIASNEPLDTDFGSNPSCSIVSSGSNIHEYTSSSCMESLFKYIKGLTL